MTQEEKEILIQDICARLPYGIKCTTKLTGYNDVYVVQGMYEDNVFIDCPVYEEGDDEWMIESIIPFLRPMSSMTDEERNEATQFEINNLGPIGFNWNLIVSNSSELIDWLNKKMFDYRGLIPMGLALEAPEGMYN